MALITSVDMSIQRISFVAGSICSIRYSYIMQCDELEVENKMGYIVWCELWGRELFGDRLLGEAIFDSHSVVADHQVRNKREFTVPCEILNDRVGPDELYIKVKAESTLCVEFEGQSPIVKDAF